MRVNKLFYFYRSRIHQAHPMIMLLLFSSRLVTPPYHALSHSIPQRDSSILPNVRAALFLRPTHHHVLLLFTPLRISPLLPSVMLPSLLLEPSLSLTNFILLCSRMFPPTMTILAFTVIIRLLSLTLSLKAILLRPAQHHALLLSIPQRNSLIFRNVMSARLP